MLSFSNDILTSSTAVRRACKKSRYEVSAGPSSSSSSLSASSESSSSIDTMSSGCRARVRCHMCSPPASSTSSSAWLPSGASPAATAARSSSSRSSSTGTAESGCQALMDSLLLILHSLLSSTNYARQLKLGRRIPSLTVSVLTLQFCSA